MHFADDAQVSGRLLLKKGHGSRLVRTCFGGIGQSGSRSALNEADARVTDKVKGQALTGNGHDAVESRLRGIGKVGHVGGIRPHVGPFLVG